MAVTDPPDDSTGPTDDPSDSADPTRVPETPLHAAREALRVERRRVIDEREAFEAFRSRVRDIPPDANSPVTGAAAPQAAPRAPDATTIPSGVAPAGSPPVGGGTTTTGCGLVAVRDAYEETVMSVPHYETEYNDTYQRSLVAEFGPEVAAALTRESRLYDRSRSSVLSMSAEVIEKRDLLLDLVEAESASLSRATSDLRPVLEELATLSRAEFSAERFGVLDGYRARLEVLEETCDEIAERRQRERVDAERLVVLDAVSDAQTYLYQELPVTYPALAMVAEAVERIESVRDGIVRAIV